MASTATEQRMIGSMSQPPAITISSTDFTSEHSKGRKYSRLPTGIFRQPPRSTHYAHRHPALPCAASKLIEPVATPVLPPGRHRKLPFRIPDESELARVARVMSLAADACVAGPHLGMRVAIGAAPGR